MQNYLEVDEYRACCRSKKRQITIIAYKNIDNKIPHNY